MHAGAEMHTQAKSAEPVSHPKHEPDPLAASVNPLRAAQDATRRIARKPGRPATYVFDKPDDQLTEAERKEKIAIQKRRQRQNRSYHRRKRLRRTPTNGNEPSPSQVVPDPNYASAQTVPGIAPMLPNSAWGMHSPNLPASTAAAPRLIPGFSQNPLDLLASATANGTAPSVLSMSPAAPRPASSGNAAVAYNLATATLAASRSTMSSDRVSRPHGLDKSAVPINTFPSASDISPLPPIGNPAEDTLEIDATSHTLDISSFGLGITKPSQEEDDDGTDALVDSALLSEKPRPPDRESLTDVMQRENNLIRLTGIKQIVFDNLRTKYLSMTPAMQTALRHFVVFPRSFNLHAATSVAGLNDADLVRMQGMLDSMIHTNFVTTTKGRYEINEAARLFLNEDDTVFNDNLISNTLDVAQKRFINHFKTQLGQLQDDRIHTKGFWREQAMALYDSERDNMEFSEYLLNGRNSDLREFLSAGITVMRYCVSAADRERLLRKALSEDDTSTENIFLSLGLEAPTASTSSTETALHGAGPVGFDRAHRARLYLALSEALFDQLKMEEAENPLKCADELTRDLCQQLPRNGEVTPWGIVDSVLVNLLMSNLRFGTNRFKEAQGYCVRALTTLRDAGLGRSTFGINAMSNLVQCYLSAGRLDKAKSVAGKLLDTLNEMRYTGMPIYADALGVCAMVSMAEHNYSEAERQYGTAVETVHTWGSKEWTGVPLQHCMDLDLWLMEGLADAIQSQGRSAEAAELLEKASEIRERRHLPETPLVSKDDQEEMIQTERDLKSRSSLRHLY